MIVVILAAAGAAFGWYKFFREEPQPDWVTATPDMRFKYGSIGAEYDAGIPYWIFFVLPRMFPEKLPGPGGYASLGVAWEQGQELPIGFTKKVIGFPRVANNCASCHTASFRKSPNENPVFVPDRAQPYAQSPGVFSFRRRLRQGSALQRRRDHERDPLGLQIIFLDRLIYRYILIPITKKRLLEREKQFQWVYHKEFPLWGRGRDDAMNLTKYFLLNWPMDNSIGPTDMPSVWNLKKYQPEKGMLMNLAGDSHDARSVIIDSALGLLSAAPHNRDEFLKEIDWLVSYLSEKPAPKYPFPINQQQADSGKAVFDANCARCHASERTGTRIPVEEVGHGSRAAGDLEQKGGDRIKQGRARFWHRAARFGRKRAERIHRGISRRHLAARAVSAQRFGADAARYAQAGRRTAEGFLSRL